MKTLCIYHGNCVDGFGAAWAVMRALGEHAVEFHPGVYQKAPPEVAGRDVLIVDFSYKRPVLDEMASRARTIVILDHHESAKNDLAGYPPPLDGPYNPDAMRQWQRECNAPTAVHALFDMERSGAGITWDYLHPGLVRPRLIDLIEDRDLWQFEVNGSREIHELIQSWPYEFKAWTDLARRLENNHGFRTAVTEGDVLRRKKMQDLQNLLPVARRRMVIGGHDVPVANLPIIFTSDAGHIMCEGEPFAACYWDTAAGRVFSLRSRHTKGQGLDVSKVASLFGGGGHKDAAGFEVSWDVAAKLGLAR